MNRDVERAEIVQSLNAYLIPCSLFLATLVMSAGEFLLYNGYALGWLFLMVGATMVVAAVVAFIRFHNKLRAQGHMIEEADSFSDGEQQQSFAPQATTPNETPDSGTQTATHLDLVQ